MAAKRGTRRFGSRAAALAGVMNVDGSCRPQIVPDRADDPYAALLREVKSRTGFGAVLNTSFNIHGEPLVHTPDEAINVFLEGGADALALGPFLLVSRTAPPELLPADPAQTV